MYKLGWFPGSERDEEYDYPNVWACESPATGLDRIAIAAKTNHVGILEAISRTLAAPFLLLYVLIVARDGNEPSRYESVTPLSTDDLLTFLQRFQTFLETDARHNLWIRSADKSVLVYDRHNIIYVYENLQLVLPILDAFGLKESSAIPNPGTHAHHYHPEFDSSLSSLLGERDWVKSPLRIGDMNPGE